MRCVDRNFVHSSPAEINALQAYMTGKAEATFADIKTSVPPLSAMNDGEIAQVCSDAGYTVESG